MPVITFSLTPLPQFYNAIDLGWFQILATPPIMKWGLCLLPWNWERPVNALTNRMWRKWHCTSFQAPAFRNWQPLCPVLWKTLWEPWTPLKKSYYFAEETTWRGKWTQLSQMFSVNPPRHKACEWSETPQTRVASQLPVGQKNCLAEPRPNFWSTKLWAPMTQLLF